MESKSIQVDVFKWRDSFISYVNHKYNTDLDQIYDLIYPCDPEDHEEWYLLQLDFDKHCGLRRDWRYDQMANNLFGYKIINKKKFAWAKIKYSLEPLD
jgi:hypothetical protein